MTEFASLKAEQSQGALVIRMHRPDSRNAISFQMMEELAAAVNQGGADKSAAAIIITGGDQFFSSGRDLREVAASDIGGAARAAALWRELTDTMQTCPKPVIAAIEGHCLTGGLELALACDLRIAGEGASFAITSARLGTLPGFGATQRLPRLIGAARALELLFLANPIGVEDALRIGLINRKTSAGGALAESRELARVLIERAPLSLAAVKQAVYGGAFMPLSEALDLEAALAAPLSRSSDRLEGIRAFAEKRKPHFKGD